MAGEQHPLSDESQPRDPHASLSKEVRHPIVRAGRVALGVSLLILGGFGLFLPFLQGILFIAMGLSILSTESRRVRRLVDWLRSSRFMPERWRIS